MSGIKSQSYPEQIEVLHNYKADLKSKFATCVEALQKIQKETAAGKDVYETFSAVDVISAEALKKVGVE